MPAVQTNEQRELAELIVGALNLEGVDPAGIDPDDGLFGSGLGLDSIDALELVVAIEREYGVEIPDAEVGRRAFASPAALADFILEQQAAKKTAHAVG